MGCYLKNDNGIYFEDVDSATGEITFTDNVARAKNYTNGSWFADTELEYIKFHFKDREEVKTMQIVKT